MEDYGRCGGISSPEVEGVATQHRVHINLAPVGLGEAEEGQTQLLGNSQGLAEGWLQVVAQATEGYLLCTGYG